MNREDILNALDYIEKQLDGYYLDLGTHDEVEMKIVKQALIEFKVNHKLTEFDI